MKTGEKGKEELDLNLKNDALPSSVSLSRRSSRRESRILDQLAKPSTAATEQTDGKKYALTTKGESVKNSGTLLQKIKDDNGVRRKAASASVLSQPSTLKSALKKPKKLTISNSNLDDINNGAPSPDVHQSGAISYASDSNLTSNISLSRKSSKKKNKSVSELSPQKSKKKSSSRQGSVDLTSPLRSPLISSIPPTVSTTIDIQKQVDNMEQRLDDLTSDTPLRSAIVSANEPKMRKKTKKTDDTSSALQENIDENVKSPEKTKSAVSLNDSLENTFDEAILSLHIYKTDSLISEMNLKHPLVQIHILDASTGHYLSKSDPTRLVTSVREPSLVTYILPTITKPFNMLENETKTPSWNQKIMLSEKYLHIADPKVIIFFEILDFVNNLKALRKYPDGWNRIAWGFLKPVASDGKPTTNHDVRLQLYKYPWRLFPFAPLKSPIPFVFTCYKQPWKKYASTLYVKVAAHKPVVLDPPSATEGKIPLDQLLGKMKLMNNQDNGMKNLLAITSIKPKWRRKQGDPCKLPNRLLYSIDAGQKGSFSCCFSNNGYLLAIAGVNQSSYPIKIYKIDTGERIATLDGHQDLVYQLNWSKDDSQLISASSDGSTRIWSFAADGSVRQSSILQHPTFVYAAIFRPTKEDPRIVVTGSYDGSIRFWNSNMNSGIVQTNTPELKLIGHKSNINSICFDTEGTRLYSGDGSGLIKIWSNESPVGEKPSLHYECIKTVDALKGHPIQALRLHPSNRKLMAQTIGPNLHMLDTRIHRILTHFQLPSSKRFELENAMPSAQSYPKLFSSVINDVTSAKQQLNSIHQISSARFLKCSFSACGTFVFVGSTNGSVHFWRSESGTYLGTYNHNAISSWAQGNYPIVDISFHPHDHMIAFAIWGDKEPVRVYTWDKKQPEIKTQEEETETQHVKHLNVDKLVSSSMADLISGFPVGIRTTKNWIKSPSKNIPSDMIALLSPNSLHIQ